MMKKSLLMIMIALVMAGVSSLYAQDTSPLTLQQCIQIALENNSQLRNARYQVERAKTNVTSTVSGWMPQVSSSFGGSRSRMKQSAYTTEEGYKVDAKDLTNNSYSAQVSANMLIFDFGRTYYNIKGSMVSKTGMEHSMQNTKQNVIFIAKTAYYELLKAHRLRDVYQGAVNLADEQVKRTQTMVDIGLASQAEVLQARVNLGSNQLNLINQLNQVEMAKADLNNALGRSPTMPVDVIEEKSEAIFPDYGFEQAIDVALKNNEQIKSLELDVKMSQYNIRSQMAVFFPTIYGRVAYSRDGEKMSQVYSSELDKDFRATLGLGINLDIFSGFSNTAQLQRAKIDYKIAQENLAENKRLLVADVRDYFLRLKAYKDILEIDQQNIEAAQENLRLQQEKRRVGSGTELEVTQAQVELINAQRTFVWAEYDAKVAKSQLEVAMGVLTE